MRELHGVCELMKANHKNLKLIQKSKINANESLTKNEVFYLFTCIARVHLLTS